MPTVCPKCGAIIELGFTTAKGILGGKKTDQDESQLLFYVPGTPTSQNPIMAFQQNLHEKGTRAYPITGSRCTACGYFEFYAEDPAE